MNLPSAALGQILLWSDNHKAARPVYERLLRRTRERGEPHDTGALVFELAILEAAQVAERIGNPLIAALATTVLGRSSCGPVNLPLPMSS